MGSDTMFDVFLGAHSIRFVNLLTFSCVVTPLVGLVFLDVEQKLNLLDVTLCDESVMCKGTFLLCCLLCQNVTLEGMFSLNLTRACESKSLLSTGICLHLWHCTNFLIYLTLYFISYLSLV